MRLMKKAMASLAIGALLAPYLIWCWAQISGLGLLLDPAMKLGLHGNALRAVLTPMDFVVTIVLVLPAAWLLCRHVHERLAMHVALATAALFVTSSALVGIPSINNGFWPNVSNVLAYVALPVAVWLLAHFHRRASNYSFKPRPLRGSA